MVLEPAKNISFAIRIPMRGEKRFSFSNNARVFQVLQHLLDNKLVSGTLKEQILMLQDIQLDMDMPLHVYDIEKHGGVLRVLPVSIGLCVIDEYNDEMYVTVNTKLHTILDVKKKISGNCKMPNSNFMLATSEVAMNTKLMALETHQERIANQINPHRQQQSQATPPLNPTDFLPTINVPIFPKVYENPEHMRLYVQQDGGYKLLQNDCPIKDSGVGQNSMLYLIYYGWGPGQYSGGVQNLRARGVMRTVGSSCYQRGAADPSNNYARFTKGSVNYHNQYHQVQEEGEIKFVGKATVGQTLFSAALKMQEQLDIPVENIQIYRYTYITDMSRYDRNRYVDTGHMTTCQLLDQITVQDYEKGFIVEY